MVLTLITRPIFSKLGFIRRAETFDSIHHAIVLPVPHQQQNRIDEYIQCQSSAKIGGFSVKDSAAAVSVEVVDIAWQFHCEWLVVVAAATVIRMVVGGGGGVNIIIIIILHIVAVAVIFEDLRYYRQINLHVWSFW
jgi:hypothetical protein